MTDLSISRVPLQPIWLEVDQFIRSYYAATPEAQTGILPLEIDWNFFLSIEKANGLCLFTARAEVAASPLLGLSLYFLIHHPQHKGRLVAICNTLAVAVPHRGQGIATSLVKTALQYFQSSTSVQMVTHGHRAVYQAKPLFPALGFHKEEETYIILLPRKDLPSCQ